MTANNVNGWIVLDKEAGISSASCTARIKKMFSAKKAGHAGTLDPFAEGVLPIALGEATKTIPYVESDTKEYIFNVKFGVSTDTYDCDGEVVDENDIRPSADDVSAVLGTFLGDIKQQPPSFSALKVNGIRAYTLARLGKKVELESRNVHIYSLKILDKIDDDHISFSVRCSKGTYIRSLAVDIAKAVNAIVHVTYLRRTYVDSFSNAKPVTFEEIERAENIRDILLPLDFALQNIKRINISEKEYIEIAHGRAIDNKSAFSNESNSSDEIIRAHYENNICALLKPKDDLLYPIRVFNKS